MTLNVDFLVYLQPFIRAMYIAAYQIHRIWLDKFHYADIKISNGFVSIEPLDVQDCRKKT